MLDTRTTAHSHRANRRIATLRTIATTFNMNAIVAARSRQIKVPRPDAYIADAAVLAERRPSAGAAGVIAGVSADLVAGVGAGIGAGQGDSAEAMSWQPPGWRVRTLDG